METRTKYIVGNWKMNGDYALVMRMIAALRAVGPLPGVTPVICPPFTLLHAFSELLGMGHLALGAQNCSDVAEGTRTGDISPAMLREQGCKYVILGHSERRQHRGYTNEHIAAKVTLACGSGLVPILCVGETIEQRQNGVAQAAVQEQVATALDHARGQEIIVSYEPVWAIGTGQVAEIRDIAEMHDVILSQCERMGFHNVHILYGGSVNPLNVGDIMATPGVDGVLLGRAAIEPDQFIAIAKQAQNLA